MTCCDRHPFVRRPEPGDALAQLEAQRVTCEYVVVYPIKGQHDAAADSDEGAA